MKAYKTLGLVISLMTLILFSGCNTQQEILFCESVVESNSNITNGLYKIHNDGDYIGCSDGFNIWWYNKHFYFENEITMELYE